MPRAGKALGKKAICVLFQASFILPMSSDTSLFLMTQWLLGLSEPWMSKITIEIYSLCPTHINYWLLCGDIKNE